jgi:membrane-associated PAP2 superfamily phosphatase
MTVALALYPTARRRAGHALGIAFLLGTGFGLVQLARGAHFLSHVLWAAWVVWAVNIALLTLCCWAPKRTAAGTPAAR